MNTKNHKPNTNSMSHLLEVKDLEVKFALRFGDLTAINGVNFALDRGERLGIVGESGAGKSVTGFAIINLLSKPGYISAGQVVFEGQEIHRLPEEDMRKIRGNRDADLTRRRPDRQQKDEQQCRQEKPRTGHTGRPHETHQGPECNASRYRSDGFAMREQGSIIRRRG